jgi:hypothetical protein
MSNRTDLEGSLDVAGRNGYSSERGILFPKVRRDSVVSSITRRGHILIPEPRSVHPYYTYSIDSGGSSSTADVIHGRDEPGAVGDQYFFTLHRGRR